MIPTLENSVQKFLKCSAQFLRVTLVFILTVYLSLSFGSPATHAQVRNFPIPKSDVVIDGNVIFQLGEIGNTSAGQRARVANEAIQTALQEKPIQPEIDVSIIPGDPLTSIQIDGQHMLSITDSDLMIGFSAQDQAEAWTETLRQRLKTAQWQRDPHYLKKLLWQVLLALIIAVILDLLLRWQRRKYRRRWAHQTTQISYLKRLILPFFLCLEAVIWGGFLLFICERFPQARSQRYELFRFLRESFTSDILSFGEKSYSLINVFELFFWVIVLWLVIRSAIALLRARFLKTAIPDRGLQDAIATLLQFGLTSLGIFILLQAWGIDLSALTVLASFLGVGLGFGLQNIVNNFLSGWILLIERPVQAGDFINLGDVMGTVERIGSRSTEIRTPDRVSIIVPNSELVVSRVMNWSHRRSVSRLHLPLGIAYNSSIKHFHHAVIEAALSHPEVLRYPHPQVRFLAFGESSLEFDLMVWIRDPRRQFDIKSDLYYMLEANLRHYQINLPFPQRDVNVHIPELKSMANTWKTSDPEDTLDLPIPPVPTEPVRRRPLNLLDEVRRYSAILSDPKATIDEELEELVEQMKGANGLDIRDRRFRTTMYPKCFVGREAVMWIVKTQKATHEEALRLGQLLMEKGIIHHVTHEHSFKDEYLFYRFEEKDEGLSSSLSH